MESKDTTTVPGNKLYVVARLQSWGNIEIPNIPLLAGISPSPEMGMGYIVIFTDYNEAVRHADGYPVLPLTVTEKE